MSALSIGRSFGDELRIVPCSRKELTQRVRTVFEEWDPHDWVNVWETHQRHLLYAIFEQVCIGRDEPPALEVPILAD